MNQFCELVLDHLQDIEIVEDGAKHTLILYNCKVPLTGELSYSAADAKCSANLKVKGERSSVHSYKYARYVLTLSYFIRLQTLNNTKMLLLSNITLGETLY